MTIKLFIGVFLSLVNAIVALALLLFDFDFFILKTSAIMSFVIFIILLCLKIRNILYLARTLFLGFIGYFPIMIKALFGRDVFFSSYEYSSQGLDIVMTMYACTSLALLGNELGLILGEQKRLWRVSSSNVNFKEKLMWKMVFWGSVPLVVISSLLIAHSNGPFVFVSGYAGSVTPLPLGSIPALGVMGLLLAYVATYKVRIKNGCLIIGFLVFLLLFWAMLLRGDRNDALSAMLGLLVIYGVVRGRPFRLRFKNIAIIFPVVALLFLYGSVRSLDFLTLTCDQAFKSISSERFSSNVIKFGTVSPIASTFSNTVWAVDNGKIDLAWGQSYWEYFLRTPPAFLYPNRPQDYAWMFSNLGLRAGGGFFELAETYMNLGMVGCFLFPMLLSFFIARFFSNALKRQGLFEYLLLIGFMSVFFRGTWYQTFAFFRSFTLSITLYLLLELIYQVIIYPCTSRKHQGVVL